MDEAGTRRSSPRALPGGGAAKLDFPDWPPLASSGGAGTETAGIAGQGPAFPPAGFTFEHDELGPGEHYFCALDDQDNQAGFAHVLEKEALGTSAAHVRIRKLYVRPQDRGHGIGSRLIEEVAAHFAGRELRLKPYPGDDEVRDEDQLREFYGDRGFTDYIPQGDHEDWDAWEYMTRQDRGDPDQRRPEAGAAGRAAPAAATPVPGA
ncbi:MAG: GNAT family N-acetyltransferase, partial [Streptosporangiaceae bacterium]